MTHVTPSGGHSIDINALLETEQAQRMIRQVARWTMKPNEPVRELQPGDKLVTLVQRGATLLSYRPSNTRGPGIGDATTTTTNQRGAWRSTIDDELHARLLNWALAMRGGMPRLDLVSYGIEPGRLSPDELDAADMERLLVKMRAERLRYYRLVWLRYLARATITTQRQSLGSKRNPLRDDQLRALEGQAFRWLRLAA